MHRHPRILLAVSVLALLAALTVTLGMLSLASVRQTVRLPSGEVLRLEAVTYGVNHQWSPQSWWQNWFGRIFPPSPSGAPYVANFYQPPNQQPYLVFWFTGSPTPPTPPRVWRPRVVLAADETGREYASVEMLFEWRQGLPKVEYFRAPLPARGRTITLHFYDGPGPAVAAITVPNPGANMPPASASAAPVVPGSAGPAPPAPAPNAPPSPVTVRSGEVSVTLSELTTGLSGGGRNRSRPEVLLQRTPVIAGPGEIPWTRAALRMNAGAGGWVPVTATLRDADGSTAAQSYQQTRNGITWAAIPGFVSAAGPLSMRVTLQRRGGYVYRPEQLWTISKITVPGEGAETPLNLTRTVAGVRLEVHALAARGTPTGPGRLDLEKQPYVRLRAASLTKDRLLTVWAVDERGRRYDADLPAYGGFGAPYEYRIRMPVRREAKRVTLHFAVHPDYPTRTVDFTVLPSRVSRPHPR